MSGLSELRYSHGRSKFTRIRFFAPAANSELQRFLQLDRLIVCQVFAMPK